MFCNSAFSQTEIENVNDIIAEATKGEFLNRVKEYTMPDMETEMMVHTQ